MIIYLYLVAYIDIIRNQESSKNIFVCLFNYLSFNYKYKKLNKKKTFTIAKKSQSAKYKNKTIKYYS